VKGLRFNYILLTLCLTVGVSNASEFWGLEAWIGSLSTPDFEEYSDPKERKLAFIEYLIPAINEHNNKITQLRNRILSSSIDKDELTELRKRYKIDDGAQTSVLLSSVDVVPASLVLAQAAMESNWGRSRFAKYYHNFFGLWCFTKGCGVIPLNRDTSASHEVAKFSSLEKAIKYYMLSINRNPAYDILRQIRKNKRDNKLPLTGISLSEGLDKYAEIGYEYVETIQEIIRFNRLERFDTIGT
jgi:Bax protein